MNCDKFRKSFAHHLRPITKQIIQNAFVEYKCLRYTSLKMIMYIEKRATTIPGHKTVSCGCTKLRHKLYIQSQ